MMAERWEKPIFFSQYPLAQAAIQACLQTRDGCRNPPKVGQVGAAIHHRL